MHKKREIKGAYILEPNQESYTQNTHIEEEIKEMIQILRSKIKTIKLVIWLGGSALNGQKLKTAKLIL